MPRIALNPYQLGLVARIACLKHSGIFKRVSRHHTVVVVGSSHHNRRIARPVVLDVVQRRVSLQIFKHLLAVGTCAVVVRPVPTDCKLVIAQHVHHAHHWERHAIQVGTLVDTRTDKESAVRAALCHDAVLARVAIVDTPFGSGDKIVKHVLLLHLRASHMPILAIFVSATQVDLCIDKPVFKHKHAARLVRRIQRDVEAAVAVNPQRIAAVALQPLLVGERHRHLRSVLA